MNVLVIVGWGLLLGAGILLGLGAVNEGDARAPLLISAISLAVPGFIMLKVGRRVGRLVGANPRVLNDGLSGEAVITAMGETGISMGGIEDPVFAYDLEITLPGEAAYSASVSQRTPRMLVGAVLPGTRVAVKVDTDDRSRVAIDWSGQIVRGVAAGGDPTTRITGVRPTADILRMGTRGTARVEQIRKLGELGDFAEAATSAEADDPVFHMILTVTIPGRPEYRVETAQRFPDGVRTRLTPGMEVPVAVDLDDPMDGVAIDLEQLG